MHRDTRPVHYTVVGGVEFIDKCAAVGTAVVVIVLAADLDQHRSAGEVEQLGAELRRWREAVLRKIHVGAPAHRVVRHMCCKPKRVAGTVVTEHAGVERFRGLETHDTAP